MDITTYTTKAGIKMRIVAKGPRIQTWVNGHPVEDLVNRKKGEKLYFPECYLEYYKTMITEVGMSMKYRDRGLREEIRCNAIKAVLPDDREYAVETIESGVPCYFLSEESATELARKFLQPLPI